MAKYPAINEMDQLLDQISPLIKRLSEVVDDPSMIQDLRTLAQDFITNPTKEVAKLVSESMGEYDYAKLICHVDEDDNYIEVWSDAYLKVIKPVMADQLLDALDPFEL